MLMITDEVQFLICKSQNLKNLTFGNGSNFVWQNENGYAVKIDSGIQIYDSDFSLVQTLEMDYPIENLFGGNLL